MAYALAVTLGLASRLYLPIEELLVRTLAFSRGLRKGVADQTPS